jgi:hypothetical protein
MISLRSRTRMKGKEVGLPTPPMCRPQRSSTSPQPEESNGHGTCDDWLRELFSGTFDLREAEARRRLSQGRRPKPPRDTQQVER